MEFNMKKFTFTIAAIAIATLACAQNNGITPQMLKQMESSFAANAENRALGNAIQANPLNKLALNRENRNGNDTYFSNEVKSKGISDQKQSGRCWLFTGMNLLRQRIIAKYKMGEFFLSQNYLFFYDQLEKSNLFLQGVIDNGKKPMDDKMVDWLFKNPLSDGGQYTGICDLVMKYGVVPAEIVPETESSDNTSQIAQLLKRKLREDGLELRDMIAAKKTTTDIQKRKTEMLTTVYRMLALTLGKPIDKFTWTRRNADGKPVETKEYTPKEFYNEYIGDDLINNYVMFMNDPTRDYHKLYTVDFDRHTYDGENWTYVNLPIEEIKQMAIASIKDSTMMYLSCDVVKDLNRSNGWLDVNNYDYQSLFGTTFGMDKKQRIKSFDSSSSHAMTLMAVDMDKDGKPLKWEVENSWGPTYGVKGHLIMTDRWFSEYVFRLVVNKKYVPAQTLEILKQKPVRLPAWDPMFASEE
jgi:bleomycin hydrolase